jgi:hypothetical protein
VRQTKDQDKYLDDRRFEDVDSNVVVVKGDVMEESDIAENLNQGQNNSSHRNSRNQIVFHFNTEIIGVLLKRNNVELG